MRTTFSNTDTIDAFVTQGQEHGKSSNGNIFFQDDIIYSYGTHFPMARVDVAQGHPIAYCTTQEYSVTTACHISKVRVALSQSGYELIHVNNVNAHTFEQCQLNYDLIIGARNEVLDKMGRARIRKEWYRVEANDLATMANRYAEIESLTNRSGFGSKEGGRVFLSIEMI